MEENDTEVEILLSTYNGERYIKEQLESIIPQCKNGERITIRDDGSTDSTPQIIRKYADNYSCVHILEIGNNIGVTNSFSRLMQSSQSRYNLLCDQDDIWFPTKLISILDCLKESEVDSYFDPIKPCLVVSEMMCINSKGIFLNKRFSELHGVKLKHNSMQQLLIQNTVTGAACGFNSQLREIALVGIESAFIHDWWIALCAASQGKIMTIETPLVGYRLHQSNVIGANDTSLGRLIKVWRTIGISKRVNSAVDIATKQAFSFSIFHQNQLSRNNAKLVNDFVNLNTYSFIEKRKWLVKNKVKFSSSLRNIALFVFLK